ncbi:hypothetical protein I4Q36_05770 [Tuanshanicoccus lijuaniae]|uniref:CvfB family protein n=1 Tax=Aerococcaceae bacterium zg-1292 TaxID=2774330 RepID=UPI00193563B9|nr:hypothetical protein [Aerococcaceae bacterium zg-1292]QQA38172.1 hypothetical protein I4Q36_05770 [Aerococcaceae bacterium zg-1292]
MTLKYGEIVVGNVIDENETHYFVQYDGVTYGVDKTSTEDTYTTGEQIEGLIYENRFGKRVMQTELPDIRPGYYGWGVVNSTRKDLGVFVDIGLLDKEVVLSLDDLPENRLLWPKKGDKLYVTYKVDAKNRMWAQLADYETIACLFTKAPKGMMNQTIEATVFQVKLAGVLAITEHGYRVFIHESEMTNDVRVGEQLSVRVINVARDGSLNASMKPRAHEAISDDAQMLLAILEKSPVKFLGLHDKSNPDMIQSQLGISKAQFKRAVGQLLKQGKIRQEKNNGIYLVE